LASETLLDMQDSILIPPSEDLLSGSPVGPVTLSEIREPVREELKQFKAYFRDAMRSDVGILDKITQYVLRLKGKQIRPVLVLLAAKTCGEISETTYRGAALVELLHTATLVHDDVVDESAKRRGAFSINALWKNKVAVLFGDFLLSRGLLMSLEHRDYELLHIMSDAVRRMSEGELLQIEKSRKLDIDEETYFRIISDKTASLISACTASGAASATATPGRVAEMRQFGEELGLAFQIRDDLFDYGLRDVGKPLGIDIQERKMTLPLIYSLRQASGSEKRKILRIVRAGKPSKADLRSIASFVDSSGGLDYARTRMNDLADAARGRLRSFPESTARESLVRLVDYVVERKR
jgi:octaprenyl-diphosphate synthase